MFYRMSCPRCRKRIEYTDLQVGHYAYCKRCNQEVMLRGNPVRVSMYLIITAGLAFLAYGGMKMYRWASNEGRYSTSNTVVRTESAPHSS